MAYFVSVDFLYLAVINSIVSFVYSWKLKGTPFIGNLAVSWLAASTFIGGALILQAFSSLTPAILIFAAIGFLGTLSREIFKDAEDVKGDRAHEAKTLPIVIGEQSAKFVASFVLLLGIFSLIVPVYKNLFSSFYYVGIVPAILICLAAIAYMKNPHKSQKLVKIEDIFLGYMVKLRLTCTGETLFHHVSFFSKEG